MGAPDSFYIKIDISKNSAVPINNFRIHTLLKQYTDAEYAGIYGPYNRNQSFDGIYTISTYDGGGWSLDFHGSDLESQSGGISDAHLEKISELLNPESIFIIIDKVLKFCR
jgi:hypothetical protein